MPHKFKTWWLLFCSQTMEFGWRCFLSPPESWSEVKVAAKLFESHVKLVRCMVPPEKLLERYFI